MLEVPKAPKLKSGSGCMVIKTQKIEPVQYSSLADSSTVLDRTMMSLKPIHHFKQSMQD